MGVHEVGEGVDTKGTLLSEKGKKDWAGKGAYEAHKSPLQCRPPWRRCGDRHSIEEPCTLKETVYVLLAYEHFGFLVQLCVGGAGHGSDPQFPPAPRRSDTACILPRYQAHWAPRSYQTRSPGCTVASDGSPSGSQGLLVVWWGLPSLSQERKGRGVRGPGEKETPSHRERCARVAHGLHGARRLPHWQHRRRLRLLRRLRRLTTGRCMRERGEWCS